MALDRLLRDAVFSRAKGYCEKCGGALGETWALHHRKLRSRGGKDEVANLVALHHACHNTSTKSVHLNPAEAERTGFMVSTWFNPAEVSLTLPTGESVMLTPQGEYKYLGRQIDE